MGCWLVRLASIRALLCLLLANWTLLFILNRTR
nr:MAG TPA: hypothetical protein [Caudoviricetes sp.]